MQKETRILFLLEMIIRAGHTALSAMTAAEQNVP
jgi:hypothetical protein